MKKTTMVLALILGALLGLVLFTGSPALAQEEENLETILARSAAQGFLVTLTRPELDKTQRFYLADGLDISGFLAELGQVTGYTVDRTDWLTPGQTYEVQATLQPGQRAITLHTGYYQNRWKVDGLELAAPAAATAGESAPVAAAGASGPASVAGNGSGQLVFQTSSGGEIYLINAAGTGLRRVTMGMDPQLSPDGTKIAFTRWDPQFELFTINTDGTGEQGWFSGRKQMKSPTWSADGNRLIFSYQEGGRLEADVKRYTDKALARMARDGNQPDIPGNARGVSYENGVLQYTIPADAYWWLAEINLAEDSYLDLSTGSRYNYAPVGHPTDANRLYYRTDKGIGEYNSANQTSRPVSGDDRDRGGLSISPDGAKVAFTYNQEGHWEIHTINLDGSNRQRLTETPLYVLAGMIDGDTQFYTNAEGFRTVNRAQPDGMKNLNWNNTAPVWSPDGSQIAFVTDRTGPWEIWIMNADGSHQRPMFPNNALAGLNLQFNGVDERMLSWR
jgi:hypothetical protein